MRALNRLDWLPYLGFVTPPLLLIAVNGFKTYEWKSGEPFPEPWFLALAVIANVLVGALVLIGYSSKQKYDLQINRAECKDFLDCLKATYLLNTNQVWNWFYTLRCLGLIGVTCIYFCFSWGVTAFIYFGI